MFLVKETISLINENRGEPQTPKGNYIIEPQLLTKKDILKWLKGCLLWHQENVINKTNSIKRLKGEKESLKNWLFRSPPQSSEKGVHESRLFLCFMFCFPSIQSKIAYSYPHGVRVTKYIPPIFSKRSALQSYWTSYCSYYFLNKRAK